MIRTNHIHANILVRVSDPVIVHGATVFLARVMFGPRLAVETINVTRFDGRRTVRDPVGVLIDVVGKDVRRDAKDVSRHSDAAIFFIHKDVDIGIAIAKDQSVNKSAHFHRHLDDVGWGSVLLDRDSARRKTRFDMRIFTVLAVVLNVAVLNRGHVAVCLADFDDKVRICINDIVLAVISVAPGCENSSRGQEQGGNDC